MGKKGINQLINSSGGKNLTWTLDVFLEVRLGWNLARWVEGLGRVKALSEAMMVAKCGRELDGALR